jgi:PhoH-like ATPase
VVSARRSASAALGRAAGGLDLLLDPEVGIVSLGGRAGTGKSALALCAGSRRCSNAASTSGWCLPPAVRRRAGQDLGYLPGSESEKMAPWAQAVFDTLGQ